MTRVDAPEVLARHVAALTRRALRAVAERQDDERATLAARLAIANRIAAVIADLTPAVTDADQILTSSEELLTAISDAPGVPPPVRPTVPLGMSALLVNGRGQPRIGTEVSQELASADDVDLLCAFIKWHGLRLFSRDLEEFVRRGGRLRVITTTYLGATEQRALDRLVELGAQVKISYDTRTTRLHAKAWLFRRADRRSTPRTSARRNLSKTALTDGLEWNVRLSSVRPAASHRHVRRRRSTSYWADPAFETYDPAPRRRPAATRP